MNKELLKKVGFSGQVKLLEEGKCPFCSKVINQADFRDTLSKREFEISGLCQVCQDDFFGRKV